MPEVGERVIVKITRYGKSEDNYIDWVSETQPAWVVAERVPADDEGRNYDVDHEETLLCEVPPGEDWDGFMLLPNCDTYEIIPIDEAPDEVRAALVALELREAANME
jgi:hypothetical protein